MVAFQTLGQLGDWLGANPGVRVVDPGIPLTEWTDGSGHGPAWDNQPSVRKVVGFAARNLASIPLHLYERVSDTDRQRVTDGLLAGVVARPSTAPAQTPIRFWENVLIDGLLHDRWCLKIVEDIDHLELVRIPARRVHFHADGLDRIDEIRITDKDGKLKGYDPAGFIIDTGYATRGANGSSPLHVLQHLLEESREAVEYRRSIWKNAAQIPAVLERETPWSSQEAFDRFKTSWAEFRRNGAHAGGTPILEDGLKLREVNAFKPQDTLDLEGRKLTDAEVASTYHIAPELVGARESNFASLDAYRQMLYRESLGPYIDEWIQALNTALIPRFAEGRDLYIEPHLEAKLRGSFEEQAKVLSTAIGAPWMLRSEGRGRLNLPHIDNTDELVTPLNVIVGGQASPRDAGSQNEKAARGTKTHRSVLVKARANDTHVARNRQVLQAFFARQEQVVKTALGVKATGDWWDDDRWNRELADDLLRLLHSTSVEAAVETLKSAAFTAEDYDEAATLAFLKAVAERIGRQVNEATKAQIEAALESDEPGEQVRQVYETAKTSRAEQSAITLVTTASAFGTVEAARQVSGDAATKSWLVISDNPRPTHAAMHGETVPVGEKFSNGADWPGDGHLPVDEIAGCTCGVAVNF